MMHQLTVGKDLSQGLGASKSNQLAAGNKCLIDVQIGRAGIGPYLSDLATFARPRFRYNTRTYRPLGCLTARASCGKLWQAVVDVSERLAYGFAQSVGLKSKFRLN